MGELRLWQELKFFDELKNNAQKTSRPLGMEIYGYLKSALENIQPL
jgi:hypothetical protein